MCSRYLILISLFFLSSLSGCKKDTLNSDTESEFELAANAFWINSESAQRIQSVDSVSVVFNGTTSQLDSLETGDIIVCGIYSNAPTGFLRRITSRTIAGNIITVITSNVSLTEAFDELHIHSTKTFAPIAIAFPNVTVYDEDGSSTTLTDQVNFNGDITVIPELTFEVDIHNGQLTHAKIGGAFKSTLNRSVEAAGSLTVNAEVPLYQQPLSPVVIPGTPVVILPVINVVLGAEGSLSAGVTYANNATDTSGAYLIYDQSSWSTISQKGSHSESNFSGYAGNINLKAYVKPAVDLRLWGLKWASASAFVEAYAKLTAQVVPAEPCNLTAGISAGVNAKLKLFHTTFIEASYPNIFDFYDTLFTCSSCGPVTDLDGNLYNAITIGNQCWLVENLKTTKFRNGDNAPYIDFNNNPTTSLIYGRNYNWDVITDSRGICPLGWHIPTDAEWKELELYLGMSQSQINSIGVRGETENIGGKLKMTTLWAPPNLGATNSTGFSAVPFNNTGGGSGGNYFSVMWTSTPNGSGIAITRSLFSSVQGIDRENQQTLPGHTKQCRCIKD